MYTESPTDNWPSIFSGINFTENSGGFASWKSSIDFKTFLSLVPSNGLQLIAKHFVTGFSTVKFKLFIVTFFPIQSNSSQGLTPSIIIFDLN